MDLWRQRRAKRCRFTGVTWFLLGFVFFFKKLATAASFWHDGSLNWVWRRKAHVDIKGILRWKCEPPVSSVLFSFGRYFWIIAGLSSARCFQIIWIHYFHFSPGISERFKRCLYVCNCSFLFSWLNNRGQDLFFFYGVYFAPNVFHLHFMGGCIFWNWFRNRFTVTLKTKSLQKVKNMQMCTSPAHESIVPGYFAVVLP